MYCGYTIQILSCSLIATKLRNICVNSYEKNLFYSLSLLLPLCTYIANTSCKYFHRFYCTLLISLFLPHILAILSPLMVSCISQLEHALELSCGRTCNQVAAMMQWEMCMLIRGTTCTQITYHTYNPWPNRLWHWALVSDGRSVRNVDWSGTR